MVHAAKPSSLKLMTSSEFHNVSFVGGCNGNLQGIGRLVEGMPLSEIEKRLSGIRCGIKNTSCPDQLAYAVHQVNNQQ